MESIEQRSQRPVSQNLTGYTSGADYIYYLTKKLKKPKSASNQFANQILTKTLITNSNSKSNITDQRKLSIHLSDHDEDTTENPLFSR